MGCQISTNCVQNHQHRYKFSSRLLHSFWDSTNNPESTPNITIKSDNSDFQSRLDRSIASYQQFLQANYGLRYPFDGLGNVEDQVGCFQGRVEAWYQESRQIGLINGNPFDALSLCYSLKKDVSEGKQWYQGMLSHHPTNQYLHFGLGNIYYKLEMYEQAEKSYRKAIQIHPRLDKAYQNIANIYCFKKIDNSQAEEWSRFALKLNPNNYYASLINALVSDNISHQIHLLEKLLESCPNYARVYNALGHSYMQKRKYNMAIKYFFDGYSKCQSYFAIPCGMALAYNKIGKFDEAAEWSSKAMALNPHHHEPYHCLGDACRGKGEIAEAKRWYLKAIEIEPQFNETYLKLGKLQSGSNPSQAIKYYETYLCKNEDNSQVLYELAKLHIKRGQIQIGVRRLLTIPTLETDQEALFLLAQSLLQLKMEDKSSYYFNKYISNYDNSEDATSRVAKSLQKFNKNHDKVILGLGEK